MRRMKIAHKTRGRELMGFSGDGSGRSAWNVQMSVGLRSECQRVRLNSAGGYRLLGQCVRTDSVSPVTLNTAITNTLARFMCGTHKHRHAHTDMRVHRLCCCLSFHSPALVCIMKTVLLEQEVPFNSSKTHSILNHKL